MALIEVAHVSKTFLIPTVRRTTVREHALDFFRHSAAERLTVLDDVSFSVEAGETVGIMGRNGCGKSTLLKIVAQIYTADEGRVRCEGAMTPLLELGVGWNPDLDALDNILLIGTVMGVPTRRLRGATDEILAFAEVERFAHLKLQHFSSGMALRLAYAVAFAAVRDILVLDEIFAVGDAGFKLKCEERFLQLKSRGVTTVLVSHDPRIITRFCDRAILLESGRIRSAGAAAGVAEQYLNLVTEPALAART